MKLENYNPINTHIENKENPVISKDFFNLQFEFAKELYQQAKKEKREVDFVNIIINYAPALRTQAIEYHKEKDQFEDHFKTGITEENLLNKAYDAYVLEEKTRIQETSGEPNQKFGPLYYLTSEDEGERSLDESNITFHFSNDFSLSPRQLLNIEDRKKDMENLLRDIKVHHPNTKTLSTASWLLDTSMLHEILPQSFIDSIKVKESQVGWGLGTMIWGQFLDSQGKLKKYLADELLKNLKNRKDDEYLIDLLKPPLHKPKSGIAPIEDFYSMYKIDV